MNNVTILNRVRSLCVAAPFNLVEAPEPFDFDRVPTTKIADCFRVTTDTTQVVAGLSYSEERFDTLTVWVARRATPDVRETYQGMHTLINSLTAALVRAGTAGDFTVTDDRGTEIQNPQGSGVVVGQLTQGVSYMVEV